MRTPDTRTTAGRDVLGLVWQRRDFRESSRLVTFLTPSRGRLTTLAKGAHRPGSQCLGRIDFLNLVEIKFSSGTLPILHRVRLRHEHRRLRDPERFRAASYLSELFDGAFLPGRPEPELFDLLSGGLLLIERCPHPAIRQILLGLELRFLGELGQQPGLEVCSRCGGKPEDGALFVAERQLGLACRSHAGAGARRIPSTVLAWLREVRDRPGRTWPKLPPAPRGADALLGRWIQYALERRPQSRRAALQSP